MKVDGVPYRTIWPDSDGDCIRIIDQTRLPHEFVVAALTAMTDAADAIRTMPVRGAPLIGATAAYGVALATPEAPSDENLDYACRPLMATRPTAVNPRSALADLRAPLLHPPRAIRARKRLVEGKER